MDLVIDIGNSNVVLGFYGKGSWEKIIRLLTVDELTAQNYYSLNIQSELLEASIGISEVENIYLCSVVPKLNAIFMEMLESIFALQPKLISISDFSKLQLSIDRPSEIGMDLVANGVAAVSKYVADCIIIDFGTALTFTTISKNFELLGVAIAPGLHTAMSALHSNTAQLPDVPLELPLSVIGKNTTHAIQSGVLWGYIGLVKEITSKINTELNREHKVIATGGLSSILHPLENMFHTIDKNLTLEGIRIIGSSNL